jgi:hypothetical protein
VPVRGQAALPENSLLCTINPVLKGILDDLSNKLKNMKIKTFGEG